MLSQRMADELMNMSIDEAMPLTRALGHYLGLTSIAELHHRQVALRNRNASATSVSNGGWTGTTIHSHDVPGRGNQVETIQLGLGGPCQSSCSTHYMFVHSTG